MKPFFRISTRPISLALLAALMLSSVAPRAHAEGGGNQCQNLFYDETTREHAERVIRAVERLSVEETGHIRMGKGRTVYYEHAKGEGDSRTTILLMNGLVYNVAFFKQFKIFMSTFGYDIVDYAYSVQHESLAGLKHGEAPYFMNSSRKPTLEDFAAEGMEVLKTLWAEGKLDRNNKLIVAGLSFGGGGPVEAFARLYKDKVAMAIPMSPLAYSGDNYKFATDMQKMMETNTRMALWYNPLLAEYLIDSGRTRTQQYYSNMLVQDKVKNAPDFFTKGVPPEYIAKGLEMMMNSAENFELAKLDPRRLPPVSFFFAGAEEPSRLKAQLMAYDEFVKKSKGEAGVMIFMNKQPHAFTATAPIHAAYTINELIQTSAVKSAMFIVDPETNQMVPMTPEFYAKLKKSVWVAAEAAEKAAKEGATDMMKNGMKNGTGR